MGNMSSEAIKNTMGVNINYTILSLIIEEVAERDFTEHTRTNLFEPLQKNGSYLAK